MPEPTPVSIAIADDHPIFRDGLRLLLESEPGFHVVGECADGDEATAFVERQHPDVLLLDVAMPKRGGLEALPGLLGGRTKVILLTAAIQPADVLRATQMGAAGIVLKEWATQNLVDGIRRVIDGNYVIGMAAGTDLASVVRRSGVTAARPYGLTPREHEVVEAIADGLSNREIATRFGISQQTVKHHLTSIFNKMDVGSRLELALLAVREGIGGRRH